jgi:KDO2-lipid IV(A) lauroyltransferase
MLTTTTYDSLIEFGDVTPALREAVADRPVLLVTGHCGNWEVLGYAVAMLGLPMHALYRPLDMAPLDRWVRRTRERRGLRLVDKFGAAQRLPKLVADHKLVAFIADQNAGDRGLFVPFFDRLASAYKTIGVLALRYNAAVVCGHAQRIERGPGDDVGGRAHALRYRVDVVDAIGPEDWSDQPDPLFYITARYRRAIEMMVRRAPEQYLWMHRYWKSRPRHERTGGAFPDRLREKLASLPWMEDGALGRLIERSERDAMENSPQGALSV